MATVDILSDHRQESVFAIFQLMSIYHWAKISDIIGRRPVVLIGSVGMGLMTLLFGFSRNLTYMLITRSLHGIFAGQYKVSRPPDLAEQWSNREQETSRSFTASLENSPTRRTKLSSCQFMQSVGHSVLSSAPCLEERSVTLLTSSHSSISLCCVSIHILCPVWCLLRFLHSALRWVFS